MRYTRKGLEKKIKDLGGTTKSAKARILARKFNDILVREKVRKYGIKSLNPNDPADRRFLIKKKLINKRVRKIKYWKFPKGKPAPNNYLWDGKGWRKRLIQRRKEIRNIKRGYHTHWVAGRKWNTRITHLISVQHRDIETRIRHDLAIGKLQRWAKRKKLHLSDRTYERYKEEVLRRRRR
jgi:hypothetical protein